LTGFGLAKQLQSGDGRTRTGEVMGTPSYMAPEQAGGRKEIGPAADVLLGALIGAPLGYLIGTCMFTSLFIGLLSLGGSGESASVLVGFPVLLVFGVLVGSFLGAYLGARLSQKRSQPATRS